jgi:hypothetical protein
MSWDIFVQEIPPAAETLDDMPDDYQPVSIGKRTQIISAIQEILPDADFRNPAWGIIDGPDHSLDVNMGDKEDLKGFAFHVRGGGNAALVVADILNHLGLRALDPSSETGIFGVAEDAQSSMRKWRIYRNCVLNGHL